MKNRKIEKFLLKELNNDSNFNKVGSGYIAVFVKKIKGRSFKEFDRSNGDTDLEQRFLEVLYDLFQKGYLSWGCGFGEPEPPWFHITRKGNRKLKAMKKNK